MSIPVVECPSVTVTGVARTPEATDTLSYHFDGNPNAHARTPYVPAGGAVSAYAPPETNPTAPGSSPKNTSIVPVDSRPEGDVTVPAIAPPVGRSKSMPATRALIATVT